MHITLKIYLASKHPHHLAIAYQVLLHPGMKELSDFTALVISDSLPITLKCGSLCYYYPDCVSFGDVVLQLLYPVH